MNLSNLFNMYKFWIRYHVQPLHDMIMTHFLQRSDHILNSNDLPVS